MSDALGKRDDIVETSDITRWTFTKLLEHPKEYAPEEQRSPFPLRVDLNAKLALWKGNITKLKVHGITHTTNEHMNERNPDSDELYRQGGQGLYKEVQDDLRVCRTGEAKMSKGHSLPARYVIHSVGPRYNMKYITAADSALFSCYRTVLQICKESHIRTLGLGAIHSLKRNYPPDKGAHIAIRTVRRFLEKYSDAFDLIVFVCNEENVRSELYHQHIAGCSHYIHKLLFQECLQFYRTILPLYFPRDSSEEAYAIDNLPSDIGNEEGEPVIKERQIRILDKPTFAALKAINSDFEQTVDLNKEFLQSVAADVGHHPFANMEENPDVIKTSRMLQATSLEQRKKETRKRYENLMKRAKVEDLTEIASLQCLYRGGVDRMGRPIIVFVGRNYPAHTADPEKALLYLIRVMDPVVDNDYVVVYFHTETTGRNQVAMAYFKMVYSLLDHRYKKHLKHFYIVHPTWWSRLATWFFTTFTASDLKHKVHNLKGVQFLFTKMNPDQIDVPHFVQEYDIKINGPRYVVNVSNSEDNL